MAERPIGTESASADFLSVKSKTDLLQQLAKLPDTEMVIAAAEPYSEDILPRDKDFLISLMDALFAFAEASSLRNSTDPAAREDFLKKLIDDTIISDGGISDQIIPAIRRAIIAEYPEYAGTAASLPPAAPVRLNLPPRPVAPAAAPAVPVPPPRPAAPPTPPTPSAPTRSAPANLEKIMAKKTAGTSSAAASGAAGASSGSGSAAMPGSVPGGASATPESVSKILDDNPEFRAFFAKSDKAEQLVRDQDLAAIETYRRAFAIKDKLATDLYELANGAIKGDFLLDFENPDSHLPKNQRAEFQRYVDAEALQRPEQLLNLAFQLETRQVLEKNIATAKAEIERFGGKDLFDTAEQEALELKKHLERAHESTRRDTLTGFIPHGLHYGFLKMAYTVGEWVGWKGQTEGSIKYEFTKKRETILNGRTEDVLLVPEKDALAKLNQEEALKLTEFKRHQALGERMVEVAQQGVSRARLGGDNIRLGMGKLLSYSPLWIHHPDIARELDNVNIRLSSIRQRRQTIEQAEQNLAAITQSFGAMRSSAYMELPPAMALIRYAQAQVKNTLTSFTEDTAIEDLQRIYDYALLLESHGEKGPATGAKLFEDINNLGHLADSTHEAVVAKWGKRILEIFERAALNKKGGLAEMEKSVRDILKQEAIGGVSADSQKTAIVKGLLVEAFKKIDPTKGDGKERRVAIISVMISCGLLKKGETITT